MSVMDWENHLKESLQALADPDLGSTVLAVSSVLAVIGWNESTRLDEIVLTKRSTLVETHKGQISFPGGYREASDPDLLHTALREAEEEVGIRRADVKILGRLAPVTTLGKVVIYPWVGRLRMPYEFVPNDDEVDRLLYLPVRKLLEEGLSPVIAREQGLEIPSTGLWHDGELIWGATARILTDLRENLLKVYPSDPGTAG